MGMLARMVAALSVWLMLGVVATAESPRKQESSRLVLIEALGIPELLEIMRTEGRQFGMEIGADFLPDGGGATWQAVVARLYDKESMHASVAQALEAQIAPRHIPPLMAFLTSETGRQIVHQEILGREAFLDPATEEAARESYRQAKEAQTERLALLADYVAVNDLVAFNVAGALTSNLRFYSGLVEGGAIEMSEEEMLADVWAQEDEIRADTEEWLLSYLLMAYAPLSDAQIDEYIALSRTPAGEALNRALFAGFDAMYADLSYALGLAVALQMRGEDL